MPNIFARLLGLMLSSQLVIITNTDTALSCSHCRVHFCHLPSNCLFLCIISVILERVTTWAISLEPCIVLLHLSHIQLALPNQPLLKLFRRYLERNSECLLISWSTLVDLHSEDCFPEVICMVISVATSLRSP